MLQQLPPFYVRGFEKPFVVKPSRYDSLVAAEGVPLYHRTASGMTFVGSERQLGFYIKKFQQLRQNPEFFLTPNANPQVWVQPQSGPKTPLVLPSCRARPDSADAAYSLQHTCRLSGPDPSSSSNLDVLDRMFMAAFPNNVKAQACLKHWTEVFVLEMIAIVTFLFYYVRVCLLALRRQDVCLLVRDKRFELSRAIDFVLRDKTHYATVPTHKLIEHNIH